MKAAATRHERVVQLEETFEKNEKGTVLSAMKMLNTAYSELLFAEDALKVFIVDETQIGTLYQTVYNLQTHLQELEVTTDKLVKIAPVYQEYFNKKVAIVRQKSELVLETLDMKFMEFAQS